MDIPVSILYHQFCIFRDIRSIFIPADQPENRQLPGWCNVGTIELSANPGFHKGKRKETY